MERLVMRTKVRTTVTAYATITTDVIVCPLRIEAFEEALQEAADDWAEETLPVLQFTHEVYPPYKKEKG
jgi:hypothetical protein